METGWIVRSECSTFKEFVSFFNKKGMTPLFFEFDSILKDVERFAKNLNDEYHTAISAVVNCGTYIATHRTIESEAYNKGYISEVFFFVDETVRDRMALNRFEVKHVDFTFSVYRGTDKKNTKTFTFSIQKIKYDLLTQ